MPALIDQTCTTIESAHRAATAGYNQAKGLILAGRRVRVLVEEAEDMRSVRQNRWYWGVLLREVSEQARIDGQRWTADAWHELGKRQFLPRKVSKVAVAGRKKKTVIVTIQSTTGLSVRRMSEYLEQFSAFAATELGVRLSCSRWEDHTE